MLYIVRGMGNMRRVYRLGELVMVEVGVFKWRNGKFVLQFYRNKYFVLIEGQWNLRNNIG